MSKELLKVHDFRKDPRSGRAVLTKVTPYLRLCAKEGPPVYLKSGQILSEDGKPIPEQHIPAWFWDEVEKCNPKELEAVKFKRKQGDPEPKKRGRPPKSRATKASQEVTDGDDQTSRSVGQPGSL